MLKAKTLDEGSEHSSNVIRLQSPELYIAPEAKHRRLYHFSKRAFDLVGSALLLLALFPVFLIISIFIVSKDGTPALFKHRRIGRGGKEFLMFKFRTMRNDAEAYLKAHPELMEEFAKSYKLDCDPRITPLGHHLRRLSIDELPQLVNVIFGEMTVVGPRPVVKDELQRYGIYADVYLSLKPGCAGLWQCSGRSDTSYEERVQMDLEYARKASFWYDLQIIFRTLRAVLLRKGAR